MSQSIEIEFKNLLLKEEYDYIKAYFQLKDKAFFLQENHYFDTLKFDLKEKKSALRIRRKGNNYELTLKQPTNEGLLETNQILSDAEAQNALKKNQLPNGCIADLLTEMMVNPADIQFFGTLSTYRAEWEYKDGLLVLDFSKYLDTEDFELEYEVSNRKEGLDSFQKLLSELKIPVRKTENKIMRFYLRKIQLSSNHQS